MIQLLHVALAIGLIAITFAKNRLLWKPALVPADVASIHRYDRMLPVVAALILLSGGAMLFGFAKPTAYYMANGVFWAKMGLLVVAMGLVGLTARDLKRADRAAPGGWTAPLRVRVLLGSHLLLLVILLTLGRLLAAGHL